MTAHDISRACWILAALDLEWALILFLCCSIAAGKGRITAVYHGGDKVTRYDD